MRSKNFMPCWNFFFVPLYPWTTCQCTSSLPWCTNQENLWKWDMNHFDTEINIFSVFMTFMCIVHGTFILNKSIAALWFVHLAIIQEKKIYHKFKRNEYVWENMKNLRIMRSNIFWNSHITGNMPIAFGDFYFFFLGGGSALSSGATSSSTFHNEILSQPFKSHFDLFSTLQNTDLINWILF